MTIRETTITTIYRDLLNASVWWPVVSSRNGATREVVSYELTLYEPANNILVATPRLLNHSFAVAEWLWILTGSNDLSIIQPFNRALAEFSDDGIYLAGGYGPMFVEQLPYILQTLGKDLFSRQAVMTFWRPRPYQSKDIPCTVSLQFLVRDYGDGPQLQLLVYMRSNDLWLGFPYDVFTFTQLQRYVAMLLNVQVGPYHHHVGSLHLYEQHWEKAAQLLAFTDPLEDIIASPPMTQMPKDFKAIWASLGIMNHEWGLHLNPSGWIDKFKDVMPEPWWTYLNVLAYHFHRDTRLLTWPYSTLFDAQKGYRDARRGDASSSPVTRS